MFIEPIGRAPQTEDLDLFSYDAYEHLEERLVEEMVSTDPHLYEYLEEEEECES